MTPTQIFTIAALGGLCSTIGLALVALLGAALYAAIGHALERQQQWRERRRDLRTCRAINALPTTERSNPTR
ncbi:hypothetical protein SSP24_06310 [Streptomyces spinoverrucosus]|uniref:Uncharacterized protein n=1 Tax=Streptomyces spinoverrucosus TaxID=284043 RepID=A0A4Y3VDB8_9ACTN|nr:hypothetical protein [Streptomyces spinoverrucosus]GEC02976.1 hypothetical protein SSP24_06310 [Streptomyces spinoverrucosus]GHB39150.1 hypothetical protein GCM10010397_06280 [Streptomyces spinoverrucosus]